MQADLCRRGRREGACRTRASRSSRSRFATRRRRCAIRSSTRRRAELGAYRAVLDTTKGSIELEFMSDKAPETVRQFLRLAAAGVFDGTAVHRVVPNFVIQTGALAFRNVPLTAAQNKLVHNLQPEFSDTPNVPGIVSMARGDDPASAIDVVLHLHRRMPCARRQVHGLRTSRQRDGRAADDRVRAGGRRDAEGADHAQDRDDQEIGPREDPQARRLQCLP